MSIAEVILGANLYKDAVNADIPDTIRDNPDDYQNFQLAFRDMSKWLVQHNCVTRDENGSWNIHNDGINKISEEKANEFLPLYQTTVMEHRDVKDSLKRDGKSDYLEKFEDLHADTIFELEPETMTRVRGDDMQNIASRSLNLLDAVEQDRANAIFIPGLDQNAMNGLRTILEDSGYLLPGENPDRQAALGSQSLRGTRDQQEALYTQTAAISANLDLPETINQGDKPATAAMMLKTAVSDAHIEEIPIQDGQISDAEWDSDLTRTDAGILFDVITKGDRLIRNAQWENIETLAADPKDVDALKTALATSIDNNVAGVIDEDGNDKSALGSGNFSDPHISPEQGKSLSRAVALLDEAVNSDPDLEKFTGDDGGLMTQEGQEQVLEEEIGDAVSEPAGRTDDENRYDAMYFGGADNDMAAEKYGPSDTSVRIREGLVRGAYGPIRDAIDDGVIEKLRQRAGLPESEMGEIDGDKPAYGTLEEAVGSGQQTDAREYDPQRNGNRVVTINQKNAMNPTEREKFDRSRPVVIRAGQGAFKDYSPGAPHVAARRMSTFIDNNMLDDQGRPNLKLRTQLREGAQRNIEATSRPEGEAFQAYAMKFVERDRQEQELRREAGQKKHGITRVDFKSEKVGRFLDVYEASESRDPARVTMNRDGDVAITHPDAPKLSGRMDTIPQEVRNTPDNAPRKMGGLIDPENLKAAYQTGSERITLLIEGERPLGAISKTSDAPEKNKTKSRKVEDVVLS